eukprot:TRINITY_DN6692_c0_g5_i1.p1 TRINITY_DN6692_c0_g5~~TRINITY_DN6692_c0_g5_i1.p1  ORF type:complete len:162 (+),score=27.74 TRINITY_DN6692_c0_g5_i1:56-541(+)
MSTIQVTAELYGEQVVKEIFIPSASVTVWMVIDAVEKKFQIEAVKRRRRGDPAMCFKVVRLEVLDPVKLTWRQVGTAADVGDGAVLYALQTAEWWNRKDTDAPQPPIPHPASITAQRNREAVKHDAQTGVFFHHAASDLIVQGACDKRDETWTMVEEPHKN